MEKRRKNSSPNFSFRKHFTLLSGLEDFENKIDKVTKGVDNDDTSLINQLFNKYGSAITNVNKGNNFS